MPCTLALLLDDANARRTREEPAVGLLLLERTLYEPPRAAACRRWADRLHRTFPQAELAAYAWHLVSHGPSDGLRDVGTRTLSGDAARFGGLADTPEVAQAMSIVRTCMEALQTDRLVVRTPPSITPGAIGRRRVSAFLASARASGLRAAWEPEGLWTPEDALGLGRAEGAAVLLPGFEGGRPRWADDDRQVLVAGDAWLRVDGAGPRRTLSGAAIDALGDHVAACPQATLVFAGPRALSNLRAVTDALNLA